MNLKWLWRLFSSVNITDSLYRGLNTVLQGCVEIWLGNKKKFQLFSFELQELTHFKRTPEWLWLTRIWAWYEPARCRWPHLTQESLRRKVNLVFNHRAPVTTQLTMGRHQSLGGGSDSIRCVSAWLFEWHRGNKQSDSTFWRDLHLWFYRDQIKKSTKTQSKRVIFFSLQLNLITSIQ